MKNFSLKLVNNIKKIKNDHEGVAAVEFALILPILVMLFLGTFELGQVLTVDRRVTQAASSSADLVAQNEQVDDDDLAAIMNLADSILSPYDSNLLDVDIISLSIDADSKVTVLWSYSKSGDEPYAEGADYPLNDNLATLIIPSTGIIVAKTSYTYTSVIGTFFTGGVELEETFYLRPRRTNEVPKCAGACPAV